MSLMSALARMEAVAAGRAQPRARVRHRYLSERPLVFVPLTTAGEAGAPLGALVGTDRAAPELLVVPQPRDRDLRFAFLAGLSAAVLPHLESALDEIEWEERKETDPETGKKITVQVELCTDAPQLIVPNAPGADFVRLLGRSMRFRRTAEEAPEEPHPAPPRVPLLGRWLTLYGERARVPGSSLLLSMTELLTRHWATGQSALEDQHLGALLAWIDPPEGVRGGDAALRAETERDADGQLLCPPAGPATDPAFDNKLLAPAIDRFDAGLPGAEDEVRELIASQLRPAWDAVWHGLDLLRSLPEGARVAERFKRDRWSYTAHRDRVRSGEPPQPRRDDAVTAAAKLAQREREQSRLEAQEALDDPLVMAERRFAGEAFAGEVTAVEMAWSEGKRAMPRPLVTVRTQDRPHLGEGVKAHRELPEGARQSAEFVRLVREDETNGPEVPEVPCLVTLRLTGGMGRGKEPAPGTVPDKGEWLCWTLFEHAPRGGPELPEIEDTPWTHGGPPAEALTAGPADTAKGPPAEAGITAPGTAGDRPVAAQPPLPDPVTDEDLL
ncbi:hypothetical protein K378_00922 [Streptomyces sp. Amel2xB2]|uniref:hypothetical protein n=1 Tax=Streptomyces sp. Amel2xB2 TaxID=1305829 RepID=UPI000DBF97C4|nr:hypothetical protein [Streptomyces sp. Amel2xB2]RAJ69767.1 hypothetical protein K378_00922 [Streptomyces sp. Amel2xB2]